MKKYNVSCTIIYNGCVEIEADSPEEAIEKAQDGLNHDNGQDDFPDEGFFGGACFGWGEATADYADEI